MPPGILKMEDKAMIRINNTILSIFMACALAMPFSMVQATTQSQDATLSALVAKCSAYWNTLNSNTKFGICLAAITAVGFLAWTYGSQFLPSKPKAQGKKSNTDSDDSRRDSDQDRDEPDMRGNNGAMNIVDEDEDLLGFIRTTTQGSFKLPASLNRYTNFFNLHHIKSIQQWSNNCGRFAACNIFAIHQLFATRRPIMATTIGEIVHLYEQTIPEYTDMLDNIEVKEYWDETLGMRDSGVPLSIMLWGEREIAEAEAYPFTDLTEFQNAVKNSESLRVFDQQIKALKLASDQPYTMHEAYYLCNITDYHWFVIAIVKQENMPIDIIYMDSLNSPLREGSVAFNMFARICQRLSGAKLVLPHSD
jgi:hypothetical protein